MEPLIVEITGAASREQPASTSIVYEVRNDGRVPVWMVDDRWLIWSLQDDRIELSYKRGRLRPGAQVFGYFPPEVIRLDPGGKLRRTVELEWPLRLDLLWNASRIAAPAPGRYRLGVRIGYGLAPEPDEPLLGEDVEMNVLRWQHEAASQPVEVLIPPYDPDEQTDGLPGR